MLTVENISTKQVAGYVAGYDDLVPARALYALGGSMILGLAIWIGALTLIFA